jgi:hypothetical protein
MPDRPVRSPDGTEHVVAVEWFPRYRRLAARFRKRRKDGDGPWWDLPDLGLGDGDDLLAGLVIGLALILLVAVGWLVVVPLLLVLVDVVIVVLLLLAGIASRVLLRRPWRVTITPVHQDAPVGSVGVVGLRRARSTRDAITDALRDGADVEQALRISSESSEGQAR